MTFFSVLIDCVFVWAILGLNGWGFFLALLIFLARDFFSFFQGNAV